MGLSCSCDYGLESLTDRRYQHVPNKDEAEYRRLDTKRRQRCFSCKQLIELGAPCGVFDVVRLPYTDNA